MADSVALVTGASRGIGAECAVTLARDGFAVALVARDEQALKETQRRCEEHGVRALVIPTDLNDEDAVRDAVRRTTGQWGRLDALVCNAGGTFMSSIMDTRASGWDRVLRLNLTHVFWLLQEAGAVFREQRSGSVITMASYTAVTAAPDLCAYSAAKAGVIALSKVAAAEWASWGVRVNVVAPGYVKTDLNRALWGDPETEAIVGRCVMNRWGESAEIAEVVSFLAGPKSSFVTGQVISVDGGRIVV